MSDITSGLKGNFYKPDIERMKEHASVCEKGLFCKKTGTRLQRRIMHMVREQGKRSVPYVSEEALTVLRATNLEMLTLQALWCPACEQQYTFPTEVFPSEVMAC